MIKISEFINEFKKNDLNFYTGVPDSLLKDFCLYLENKFNKNNYISSNEGSAVSIGIGYYLATKKIPVIYLQNSGLGNIINPIISMADKNVYKIPLFLLIGWRGELIKKKQIKDEPQHLTQGQITEKLLNNLEIKYKIINQKNNYKNIIKELKIYSKKYSKPVALLVRKNSFDKTFHKKINNQNKLSRERSLELVYDSIPIGSNIISTTGMISRELNELNYKKKHNIFMCVGGMGHAISIASGIAISKKKRIYCFDGDGSFLMHLGSSTISSNLDNLVHIVFNNQSHDSVGGQKTCASNLNLAKVAKSLGYKYTKKLNTEKDIKKFFKLNNMLKGSVFLEISCRKGNRNNLSRPKKNLTIYKQKFMNLISN